MDIRKFKPQDRDEIVRITCQVYGPTCRDGATERRFGLLNGVSWQERKTMAIDDDLRINPAGVFVAEDGGQIRGFITTDLEEHTRTGHISNMGVDSDSQGRGLGKALMTAALDYFRQSGMMYAKIETTDINPVAQAFYPQVGFQELVRMIHYFMKLEDRPDLWVR